MKFLDVAKLLNVCIYLRKSRADREAEAVVRGKLWPGMNVFFLILPRNADTM